MTDIGTVGLIGGSGMLGRAIAQGLLDSGALTASNLWISNRSGQAPEIGTHAGFAVTCDNDTLVEACDTILLSVPPAQVPSLGIARSDKLFISVMAGVPLATLHDITGSPCVVRAMSSPAAARRLAYSPWIAADAVTAADRERVSAILGAIGLEDEIGNEDHIAHFTAITGPVPGFVAYFARCVADYAVASGIEPTIADRAVRQLFLSGGVMLAEEAETPAQQVTAMIDYSGTTAAGLLAMEESPLSDNIARGLEAAVEKTRRMTGG